MYIEKKKNVHRKVHAHPKDHHFLNDHQLMDNPARFTALIYNINNLSPQENIVIGEKYKKQSNLQREIFLRAESRWRNAYKDNLLQLSILVFYYSCEHIILKKKQDLKSVTTFHLKTLEKRGAN